MILWDWLFGKSGRERPGFRKAKDRDWADGHDSSSESGTAGHVARDGGNPPGSGLAWTMGDRVLARWHDTFFYPGRVRTVSGSSCEIYFDDGEVGWVDSAQILAPDVEVGSRVFARIHGGPAFVPGIVSQRRGETVQVHYDHGEQEWTSLSMVRVQRAGVDVGKEGPFPGLVPPGPVEQAVDLGEPADDGVWRVGDRVLVRWLDFFWYPGTILSMGTKGYHILYDDGDQRVVQEPALMPLAVEEGERIQIRPKSQPQRVYAPAVVTHADGESLDVAYEDGEHETNTKVSRARFWRCPVATGAFPFEEGDRVLAYDIDACVYPAEILSLQDDRVIVQYLDGPQRMLTPELIRRFDLRAGGRIQCRRKGGPRYLPGVLAQIEGDRALVRYDDGVEEWTSVRLVRIEPERSATGDGEGL